MFEFDLQVLLDARQANEEKTQMALAESLRELGLQKELLNDIRDRHLQMVTEYYALEGHPVESFRLILYREKIAEYHDQEMAQEERCRLAEEDVAKKRLALIEAAKQRKIMELLKEKKFLEYRQELSAKEIKELDEAAILRYEGEPS